MKLKNGAVGHLYDAQQMDQFLARLLYVFRATEWNGKAGRCPACDGKTKHSTGCILKSAMSDLKKVIA